MGCLSWRVFLGIPNVALGFSSNTRTDKALIFWNNEVLFDAVKAVRKRRDIAKRNDERNFVRLS